MMNYEQSAIFSLAENDQFLPGAIARNILHAAGVLNYTEPINLNREEKSAREISKDNSAKKTSKSLEVYPNPATDYCIVRYKVEEGKSAYLHIVNMGGAGTL